MRAGRRSERGRRPVRRSARALGGRGERALVEPAPTDLAAALDHAPTPLVVLQRRGLRVVAVNRAAARLLAAPVESLLGRSVSTFRDRRSATPPGGGARQADVYCCRRGDGRRVWLRVGLAPVPADGTTAPDPTTPSDLLVLHLTDVSHRRAEDAERSRRETVAQALAEVRTAVRGGATPGQALGQVCSSARALLQADDAVVLIPAADGATVRVRAADGAQALPLAGAMLPLEATVAARVLARGMPVLGSGRGAVGSVITHRLPRAGTGSVLAVPLRTPEVVLGALCVVRDADRPYTEGDLALARDLADHAAQALRIGDLREARERVRVLQDRERIARDLHDDVIQDLFAVGMVLNAARPLIEDGSAAARVAMAVEALDAGIERIRSTVFELAAADLGVRAEDLLRRVIDTRAEQLGFPPRVEVEGDLDDISPRVLDHVLAVVSESLSNVARHADAAAAEVRLEINPDGAVTLDVADDGAGFDPDEVARGRGLDVMVRRADLAGGTLTVTAPPSRPGTRVRLRTPSSGTGAG